MNTEMFIEKLLAKAKSAGFSDAEVYMSTSDSFESMVHEGEIISYEVASSFGLGFRGMIGGKMGYASTQVTDDDAATQLIEGAKNNLRLIECADEQFIFAGSECYPTVDCYDHALDEVSAAKKIDLALELEKRAVSISPNVKRLSDCGLFTSSGSNRIVNTKGLNLSHRCNYAGLYLSPTAQSGDDINSIVKFQVVGDFSKLDIDKLSREAVAEADKGLRATLVPSGNYRVAFRNDAAVEIISAFASAFSADAAQKGLSLLSGREGEMVASEIVSLVDDPLMPGGGASRPFDAEGVATYKKALIDSGKLTTLMHNLKTAKKQGVKTTANASRSYNSAVGVSASNLFIAPGSASFDEVCRKTRDGLLITELQGMHSGSNAVTGDFSLAAKGYRIENGEVTTAVKGITVAGNFFEWLKNIELVGNDLWFGIPGNCCVGSPTVFAGTMTVAGQ